MRSLTSTVIPEKSTLSKKRRVSKKTRKSWRKNVDIKDVNEFLEDQRLEERLGVPFAKKTNKELFAIDTSGDKAEATTVSSKKLKRELLKQKEPRCFASLKPHTAVPDPISKRNIPKKRPLPKLKNTIKKQRNIVENRQRKPREESKKIIVDAWSVQKSKLELPSKLGIDENWLTTDTIRHTRANTGKLKKVVPKRVQHKPYLIEAIEPPHPGMSYNPSYEDHQALLGSIVQIEKERDKKEAHLTRVTKAMLKKVSANEAEATYMREMSSGLPEPVKSEKDEESSSDDEKPVISKAVQNKKKTRTQRNKLKADKLMKLTHKLKKLEKRKVVEIDRIKKLEKHLQTEEAKKTKLKEKREKVKEIVKKKPKTLSKLKYEGLEPVFNLPEEITGNLRAAHPTGNLLHDRFNSLQQRNILAPSVRALKRTVKKKRFIKPDHKITV